MNHTPFDTIITPRHNYIKSVRKAKLPSVPKPSDVESIDSTKSAAQRVSNAKEQLVLKVSMFSALVLAVFGVGFGVWIQSKAVIFDGFVALVSVGLGALSVITSRYIYREDDDVFQYGYVRFEPMVNFFKSLILVLVCVYAFINALESIFSGGYEVLLDGALLYTLCAFGFCALLFAYTSVYAKRLDSDLIGVDNTEWKIDCILYLGTLSAFALLYVLLAPMQSQSLESLRNLIPLDSSQILTLSRYIDPSLLAILSLLLCVSPVRICVANFKDLIMVAPKDLDEKITQIMEELSQRFGFGDYDTHTAKSGRFYMIEINILVDSTKECEITSIKDFDKIRDYIERALEIPSYKIWLSVSFTANPKWL